MTDKADNLYRATVQLYFHSKNDENARKYCQSMLTRRIHNIAKDSHVSNCKRLTAAERKRHERATK